MSWLELGRTADVLQGLRPAWDPRRTGGSPLVAPPVQALTTYPAVPDETEDAAWGMPTVSLHRDAESLAGAVFGHRVAFGAGELRLGAVMRGGAERFLGLDALLGSDPSVGGVMLVRVARPAGESRHEAFSLPPRVFDRRVHVTRAGRRAEARLRPGPRPRAPGAPRLTARTAQQYLDHAHEHGTHFVSAVRHGNVLMQAFAYERRAFAALVEAAGHGAVATLACAPFAGPPLASAAGPIVALNPDPEIDAMIARGDWHDERTGVDSLLAGFADRPADVCARLEACRAAGPVALELTPLGQFLEFYRAGNWTRLVGGALRQRFGVPAPQPPGAPDTLDGLLLPPRAGSYHERLTGRHLAALPESRTILTQILDLREGGRVPVAGERVTLAARTILAAGELVVGDGFSLVADRVEETLGLVDRSSGRRRTVVDGFVLGNAPDGRVRVEAAAHQPARVDGLEPLLALSLRTAERLLSHGGRAAGGGLAHLDWVARLVPGTAVARHALALRSAAGRYATPDRAGLDRYLEAVLEAAAQAEQDGEPDRHVATARRAHEAFWHAPPKTGPPVSALAELELLRAHALTVRHAARADLVPV